MLYWFLMLLWESGWSFQHRVISTKISKIIKIIRDSHFCTVSKRWQNANKLSSCRQLKCGLLRGFRHEVRSSGTDSLSLLLTQSLTQASPVLWSQWSLWSHWSLFPVFSVMEDDSPATSINGLQQHTEISAESELPRRSDVKVYKEFCDFYVRSWVCRCIFTEIYS